MAKNKIERIDQEIAKVREKIARGRARPAYDPGSAERHAVRWHSSRQFG